MNFLINIITSDEFLAVLVALVTVSYVAWELKGLKETVIRECHRDDEEE